MDSSLYRLFITEQINKRDFVWQPPLMDHRKFSIFCRNRSLHFTESHIKLLWNNRFILAMKVRSKKRIRRKGLLEINKDDYDRYIYSDNRKMRTSLTGKFGTNLNTLKDVELYFHPFQYYLLKNLERVLSFPFKLFHLFFAENILQQFVIEDGDRFTKNAKNGTFDQSIEQWAFITDLAIVAQPITYHMISNRVRLPVHINKKLFQSEYKLYRESALSLIKSISFNEMSKIHRELCLSAEMLEKNSNLHTLIRIMDESRGGSIEGHIGGAIVYLALAETIRRIAELIYDKKMLEEDENGFGVSPRGWKETLFGTDRLLDAPDSSKRAYMRWMSLDWGISIRIYYEGATEGGVLSFFLGEKVSIELVDLRGLFHQAGGKGLTFADSLHNDKKHQIFSAVILDSDREDNVRVLLRAVENEKFFGLFLLNKPDFELNNLAPDEILRISNPDISSLDENQSITKVGQDITKATSMKHFHEIAKNHRNLQPISKGAEWGYAIANYIVEFPYLPKTEQSEFRPIISFIRAIRGLDGESYNQYLKEFKTSKQTGFFERR